MKLRRRIPLRSKPSATAKLTPQLHGMRNMRRFFLTSASSFLSLGALRFILKSPELLCLPAAAELCSAWTAEGGCPCATLEGRDARHSTTFRRSTFHRGQRPSLPPFRFHNLLPPTPPLPP